jgi:hypothetical protein
MMSPGLSNPHADRPWQRVGVVAGLVLAAIGIWVPVGLSAWTGTGVVFNAS